MNTPRYEHEEFNFFEQMDTPQYENDKIMASQQHEYNKYDFYLSTVCLFVCFMSVALSLPPSGIKVSTSFSSPLATWQTLPCKAYKKLNIMLVCRHHAFGTQVECICKGLLKDTVMGRQKNQTDYEKRSKYSMQATCWYKTLLRKNLVTDLGQSTTLQSSYFRDRGGNVNVA